ncbi:hypothetical protein [Halosimplex pelagicum]|uniref:CARDB domain-containing protein n=1 Tax=Halosimplex pelagicum TaxID=869886 RepID=A0A7D5T5D8_9EURY|nr:hypothetical protein [Halosimplex pelagicum]QLH83351.1 hypothetical protein HZS54_17695 [Halosimplex pelagicum]
MAESRPEIVTFDVPDQSPPGNSISVTINIGNSSKDPLPQSGTCMSGAWGFGHVAWNNPWRLYLDGTKVAEGSICTDRPDGNPNKAVTERVRLNNTTGEQRLRLEVLKVPEKTVYDEQIAPISVSSESSDPAIPDSDGSSLTEILQPIADSLGTSVKIVAVGAALGIIAFLVI